LDLLANLDDAMLAVEQLLVELIVAKAVSCQLRASWDSDFTCSTRTELHHGKLASSDSSPDSLVHWAIQTNAASVPKDKTEDTPGFNHWYNQKVLSAKSGEGLSIVKGTLFLLLRDLRLFLSKF